MCNGNKIIKHTQKFCNYLARPFLCTLFVLATTAYALIALQSNLLILLIINIVFNHDSRLCGNLEILLQTVQVAHQMIHRSCDSNLHLSMLTRHKGTTIAMIHMEYCKIRGLLSTIELFLSLSLSTFISII